MNQGETTHMAVPAFCSPLTTALYAAFGICGFVFALVGSAFSVYGRTMFISLGLSITVLGCLGVLTNYKQWYARGNCGMGRVGRGPRWRLWVCLCGLFLYGGWSELFLSVACAGG
jgi:hypothetical protein